MRGILFQTRKMCDNELAASVGNVEVMSGKMNVGRTYA